MQHCSRHELQGIPPLRSSFKTVPEDLTQNALHRSTGPHERMQTATHRNTLKYAQMQHRTHTPTHTPTHTHTHTHTYMHTCTHQIRIHKIHTHTHTQTQTHKKTHTHKSRAAACFLGLFVMRYLLSVGAIEASLFLNMLELRLHMQELLSITHTHTHTKGCLILKP